MLRSICVMAAVVVLLSGWMVPVQAAEEEAVKLGEVVVTASRQADEVAKVPAQLTVITAAEIAQTTAQNVPEAISILGGAQVSDITGNKRNFSVDIRGFGESAQQNILLLIDGRVANSPDLSGPDWNLIPLERVERIEIVRGSRGSVIYGDNALAGVVNIITKESKAFSGDAFVAYGSFDAKKASATLGGITDRSSFDISAGYLESDGYRDNSGTIHKDIGAGLNLDPSDRLQLNFKAGYHQDETRNPGALLKSDFEAGMDSTDTKTPNNFTELEDYYLQGGMAVDILSDDTFKIDSAYRVRSANYDSTFDDDDPNGGRYLSDTDSTIYNISPQLIFWGDFGWVTNRLTFGYDFVQAQQDFDSLSESTYLGTDYVSAIDAGIKRQNNGFYIQDELGVGQNWTLSGGYRLERAVYQFEEAQISEKVIDEESFSAGIAFNFSRNAKLYGSYSRGFRMPVLDEVFDYFTSTVLTNLEAAVSDNYEIGVSAEIFPGLILTANIFRIAIRDEIYFNPDKGFFGENDNMDWDTLRQGFETTVQWQMKGLRFGVGYTYTDARFDGGPYDGKALPLVPYNRAFANLGYTFKGGFFIGLDGVYVGDRYMLNDLENEADKLEEYLVTNAKVQYSLRRITFYLDLNNIFNKEYSAYGGLNFYGEPGFYPSPEFNFLAGIKLHLGGNT